MPLSDLLILLAWLAISSWFIGSILKGITGELEYRNHSKQKNK